MTKTNGREVLDFNPEVRLVLARSAQGRAEAQSIIKDHVITGIAVGLLPLPVLDLAALINVQLNLIGRLSDHYGVPFSGFYRTLITASIAGTLPVLALAWGGSVLKLLPGFGTLTGGATLSSLAGALTYATGKLFMDHFEAGGTLDDYCPQAFQRQLRCELAQGRRLAQRLQADLAA